MQINYKQVVIWDAALIDVGFLGSEQSVPLALRGLACEAVKITTGAPYATVGQWIPGAIVVNAVDATVYINTGTTALPVWSLVEATSTGSDILNNMTAITAPGVGNDNTQGYSIGSLWFNKITGTLYVAESVTTGAAIWTVVIGGGAGGGLYSVGNASNFAILAGTSLTLSAFSAPSIIATGNTGETTMAGVAGRFGSGADTVAASPYAAAIADIAALKAILIALPGIAITTPSALESNNLSGLGAGVFAPGVYTTPAAIGMTASRTITLSGAGDYIFISTGGALTFGANDTIILTNGATAARVFFVAATDLSTTGANSVLKGNFLVRDATVASTVSIEGRILASRAVVVDGTSTSFTLPLGTSGAGVALPSGSMLIGSLAGVAVPTVVARVVKFAGKVTWSGSGATLAVSVPGVLSTDEVIVTVETAATQTGYVASAKPTTDTITLTLSTANTSNQAVIAYEVFRAIA